MNKRFGKTTKLLTMLMALTVFTAAFTLPVSAAAKEPEGPRKEAPDTKLKLYKDAKEADEEAEASGTGVHKDPTVFEKNFSLTPAQKKIAIDHCKKGAALLNDEMSDLEKYYMLALWENYSVKYDSDFWPGGYDFDYYSHQWDAYGVLEEHRGICAGIAITYSNLCHAAGLPCKFVRCEPSYLDHTINYIPDINGNSYYIDVTENSFFMSTKADWSFEPIDLGFSGISNDKRPSDGSFEYHDDGQVMPSNIKDFYSGKTGEGEFKPKPFKTWFNEYALHKSTNKDFRTKYVEKGSGKRSTEAGYYHAAYNNFEKYPAQPYSSRPDTEKVTGIWFLDDFYLRPTTIKNKITNKEFDEELLIISGLEENYDCEGENIEEVIENLKNTITEELNQKHIKVKYFPTVENGKVVAEEKELTQNTDYKVEFNNYDEETHEAVFVIRAKGEYSGKSLFRVKVNSALVKKNPIRNRFLEYNGNAQVLLTEPGVAENGTMLYAKGTKDGPTEDFSTDFPTATNAGYYYIWYKAAGDENHYGTERQRLRQPSVINPLQPWIEADGATLKVGETFKILPKLDRDLPVTFSFESHNKDIATVSADGVVTAISKGTAEITIHGDLKISNPNYADPFDIAIFIEVVEEGSKNTKIEKAKLSFDPSGGTWREGGTAIKVFEAEPGTEFTIINAPKREGYTFQYWEGSEYLPGQKFKVDGDHKFTAKWKKNESDAETTDDSGRDDTSIKGKHVKTGDTSNSFIWTLLMIVSGSVAAGITITRKKRREHNG